MQQCYRKLLIDNNNIKFEMMPISLKSITQNIRGVDSNKIKNEQYAEQLMGLLKFYLNDTDNMIVMKYHVIVILMHKIIILMNMILIILNFLVMMIVLMIKK